eukprot:Colp12_sorted_trinity150504_noHs@31386
MSLLKGSRRAASLGQINFAQELQTAPPQAAHSVEQLKAAAAPLTSLPLTERRLAITDQKFELQNKLVQATTQQKQLQNLLNIATKKADKDEIQKQFLRTQNRAEQISREVTRLTEYLALWNELEEQHNQAVQQVKAETQKITDQLTDVTISLKIETDAKESLQQVNAAIQAQLAEVQKQWKIDSENAFKLQQALHQAATDKSKRIESLQAELTELKLKIENGDLAIPAAIKPVAEEDTAEIRYLRNILETSQQERDDMSATNAAFGAEIATFRLMIEDELKTALNRLADKEEQLATLTKRYRDYDIIRTRASALEQRLSEKDDKIRELEKKLADSSREATANATPDVLDLMRRVREGDAENKLLQELLAETIKQKMELANKLDNHEHEMTQMVGRLWRMLEDEEFKTKSDLMGRKTDIKDRLHAMWQQNIE